MKNKHYPIDNTEISNKRKYVGAFVWYLGKLRQITSQNVASDYVLVANLFKVKRNKIRLAKIGEIVQYNKVALRSLPDKCKDIDITQITNFYGNGLVRLSYDGDTTHHYHLESYNIINQLS